MSIYTVKVAGKAFHIEIEGNRAQCKESMGIVSQSSTSGESIDAVVRGIMDKISETQSNA
jgi:hypothetical protein